MTLPAGAVAVRVRAEDDSSATFGWVAFSHPYRAGPGWVATAIEALRPIALTAFAFLLIQSALGAGAFRGAPMMIASIATAAALLALRKPWALHTPQLWAEDGSIFLVQAEQLGLRA